MGELQAHKITINQLNERNEKLMKITGQSSIESELVNLNQCWLAVVNKFSKLCFMGFIASFLVWLRYVYSIN